MKTTGDKWMGDLSKVEGKGAFTKEVDAALLAGEADLAVHCVKDVPADRPLPAGTMFAAFLKRDDIRDALIHPGGLTLDELAGRDPDRHLLGAPGRPTGRHPPAPGVRAVPRQRQPAAGEARGRRGGRAAARGVRSGAHRPAGRDQRGPLPGDDDAADRRGHPRPAVPRGRHRPDRRGQRASATRTRTARPPRSACSCTSSRATATARSPGTRAWTAAANCPCGPACSPRTARPG